MLWEATFLIWIQEHLRSEALTEIIVPFTHLGDSGMLFIVMGILLLCIPKTRRIGLTVLTALLGVDITDTVVEDPADIDDLLNKEENIIVADATDSVENVQKTIRKIVEEKLGL